MKETPIYTSSIIIQLGQTNIFYPTNFVLQTTRQNPNQQLETVHIVMGKDLQVIWGTWVLDFEIYDKDLEFQSLGVIYFTHPKSKPPPHQTKNTSSKKLHFVL